MTTTKIYENMTVTISCIEHDDVEMLETIQRFKDSAEVKKLAEGYYRPRLEAVGLTKFEAIVKQVKSLIDIINQADEIDPKQHLRQQMVLRAVYKRDDTGESCRLTVNSFTAAPNDFNFVDENSYILATATIETTPYLKTLIEDKDGWVAKWDEYDIYSKMRSQLLERIKKFTSTNIKQKNDLIDTYHEYVED